MNPLDLILSILATFRASHMVANETGPARMFLNLRTRPALPENVKEGLACELCVGVWIAAACALWLALCGRLPWKLVPLAWLGISGGSVAITQALK